MLLISAPLFAQESDSSAVKEDFRDSKLHHILFDEPQKNPLPRTLPSGDQHQKSGRTSFEGGMIFIDLFGEQTDLDISDSGGIARVVDIRLTDQPEYADINRINDDTVEIGIYHRDKTTGSQTNSPFFLHRFDKDHTKEVRIHLRGGDDYAIVRGSVNSSILVRVIGGEGTDELVDSSHVSGHTLLVIPSEAKMTYFYGEPSETNFIYSPSTVLNSDAYKESDSLRDWGSKLFYYPWLGASNDLGAFIGAGISLADYDFREDPFDKIINLHAAYATGPKKYVLQLDEFFPHKLGGEVSISLRASSLDILNFFGYGNTTSLDKIRYSASNYKLNQQQFVLTHSYKYTVLENTSIWGSAALRYIKTDADPIKDSSVIQKRYLYGVGPMTTARFSAGVIFDSRDDQQAASNGIFASFGSFWTPEIINNTFAYTKLQADIRAYLSADILTPFTFALRMKVDKVFGEHPFYEACLLGGANDLRGYYQDRFAGEESLLGSIELRVNLASLNILVPETFGLLAFSDVGRVYVDNDFSNVWHSSFGCGFWLSPVSKQHTVSLTVAHSPESTLFYLSSGFTF